MDEKELLERLSSQVEDTPKSIEVLNLRQYAMEELEPRAWSILRESSRMFKLQLDRRERVVEKDRTLIRLPRGARLVIYHNSGALEYSCGLKPLEGLFKKIEPREALVKLVEEKVAGLNTREWLGSDQHLRFEHLWQIKASAAGKDNKVVQPVLCRIVGAYRLFVRDVPVWGPASLAIKLAGNAELDRLDVQVRETTSEVIDRVTVIRPDQAAHTMIQRMSTLWGNTKFSLGEIVRDASLRFGYFSLPRRKAQSLLAPVFVASIRTNGEEPMARQLIIAASEKDYLSVCNRGEDKHQMMLRRAGQ